MNSNLKAVNYLFRAGLRAQGVDLEALDAAGEQARRALEEDGVSSAEIALTSPDSVEEQAAILITKIDQATNGELSSEIADARLRGSAASLQSAETLVLTIGACTALIIFANRFAKIGAKIENGKLELFIHAADTKHTTANFAEIFSFLSKLSSGLSRLSNKNPDADASGQGSSAADE